MRRHALTPVRAAVLLGALLLAACDDEPADPGNGGGNGDTHYELVDAFPNLTFSSPVDIRHAGDGSNRLFVVEQAGRILVFPNSASADTVLEYLDIRARVRYGTNSEMGLLGLAFHPDYESNGYFYVYYTSGPTNDLKGRLCRFSVSAGNDDAADDASEALLLEIAQPYTNHNGGSLFFGTDGYLYLGLGDGGSQGDPNGYAQNRSALLGKLLRVDVDQNVNTIPYHGIPNDNPYVGNGNGWREEIYALGFRNPWRVTQDPATGVIWAGDVGAGAWEEIDHVVKGGNYGWDCREGAHAAPAGVPDAACVGATGLIDPVFEYSHSLGRSITGGYVYRGSAVPSLQGRYIYADFNEGTIWSLSASGANDNQELLPGAHFISTFGVDQANDLLVAGYFGNASPSKLWRIRELENE